jgi:membrane dipeptidase
MVAKEISEKARRVHQEAIIIDSLEALFPPRDVGYFPKAVEAGVSAIQCTIPHITDDLVGAITKMAEFMKLVENEKKSLFVTSAADIEKAKREGKLGIIAGMQDAMPYERNLDLIRVFYELGFRAMQVAYFQQNYLGCGCVEKVDHGLTDRGREAIQEMNRLGILIDTSHCGDRTAREAAETSKGPIAITHTTPGGLVDIPRARSDETIKAVAKKGGVIGQVIWTAFCERKGKTDVRPTISDYVDMLEYVIKLVGVDHVGLGLDLVPFWTKEDYDPFMKSHGTALTYPHKPNPFGQHLVDGFNDISDTIRITEELVKRKYSDEDIKKILGGNWLKLFRQVWGG